MHEECKKPQAQKCHLNPLRHNLYKGQVPENKEGFYGIFYKFRDAFV